MSGTRMGTTGARELRALAENATPGPWRVPNADDEYVGPYDVVSVGVPGERYVICEHAGQDAAFIAAASPDRILALLDEADHLRGVLGSFSFFADALTQMAANMRGPIALSEQP